MRDDTRNWIASAEYDIETAQDLFEAGRYPYVIFMCHLALEKMLKAHVKEVTQAEPSRTHNLPFLVRKAGLDVPPEMRRFLGEITNGSAPARYPDDIENFLGTYSYYSATSSPQSTQRAQRQQLMGFAGREDVVAAFARCLRRSLRSRRPLR